jgi:hypothetical protein
MKIVKFLGALHMRREWSEMLVLTIETKQEFFLGRRL